MCVCMYCYHIITTFYYQVSDSRKKTVKLVIIQAFNLLNIHLGGVWFTVMCY